MRFMLKDSSGVNIEVRLIALLSATGDDDDEEELWGLVDVVEGA